MRNQFIQIDHDHGFDLNKVVYWTRAEDKILIYFLGLNEPLEFSGTMAKIHYQLLQSQSIKYRPEYKEVPKD